MPSLQSNEMPIADPLASNPQPPSEAAAAAAATAINYNNNNSLELPHPLPLPPINNTNSFAPIEQSPVCGWRLCYTGCLFNLLLPVDKCSEPGCDVVFHHGCQTNWEFKRYKRDADDDNADPAQCWYDSDGKKKCMAHHPHADLALEGVPVDDNGYSISSPPSLPTTTDSTTTKTNTNNKNKKKPMSKEEKAEQRKRQIQWAEGRTINDIALTDNGKDVHTLGGLEWTKLHGDVKRAFMRKNAISQPQSMRLVSQLGNVVASHINAQGYKNNLTAPHRKSRSAATKPPCIIKEGTLFRVVNTIAELKDDYKETNSSHDQHDQDTRNPKSLAWERMTEHYNSTAESLKKLSPGGSHALLGHSVPNDVCAEYDELTVDEFKQCAKYIQALYREARNRKNQSGNHKSFGHYCDGKKWMLYFHAVLEEVGDRGLQSCAYPELDTDIVRTSDGAIRKLGRNNRRKSHTNASDRSMSMSPLSSETVSVRTKKHSAVEATTEAAHAIRNRNEDMHYDHKFDRMMNMKTQATTTNLQVMKLDKSYKKAKRKYEGGTGTKEDYKAIKVQRNTLKKQVKAYQGEYERLKKEVGYESPPSSDSSDSSDEDTDNNKGNGNKEKGNDNEETQQPQEENDDEVNNEGNDNEEV